MKSKILFPIIAAITAAAGEGARKMLRSYGQKKLQKRVNAEMPKRVKKDFSVADDHIQMTILKDNHEDLKNCQELPMNENEINEWKSLISTLGGETAKTALNTLGFSGLLKCDVPIRDLCRIKNNPEAMRGFIITDGKFSKQASFSEVGLGNVAPLLGYQLMAAVTSQYYQHIITERLNGIEIKLDGLIKIIEAEDRAKLKVSYKRFKELSQKSSYDIADKFIVSEFSYYVDIIREKYRDLLSSIVKLNVDYKWSDKGEAEQKIKVLRNSRYFDYLDLVMQSEMLFFSATAMSIRVANSLGNDEDVKIFSSRMNLDYWNVYVDQFNRIKHDVIKYLELEAEASWGQGKSIAAMKDEQLKKFNETEESMLKLQNQLNYRAVQYIEVHEDGSLKKYICLDETELKLAPVCA